MSPSQVVNLVSNDVRRFDDAGPYFTFLWAGPLEVVCVLVMVGAQLTFPAAIAGIATLLLLIPLQVKLALFILKFMLPKTTMWVPDSPPLQPLPVTLLMLFLFR